MKKIVLLLHLLVGLSVVNAQTFLTAGDIAFTRINVDDESFSFVTLVDLEYGTSFYITDETWNDAGSQGNTESTILFTTTSSVTAGEEFSISATALNISAIKGATANISSTGSINPSSGNMLGSAGDNLFIYQSASTPTAYDFIAGINANSGQSGTAGNAWQSVVSSSTSSSNLPLGLTDGMKTRLREIFFKLKALCKRNDFLF